MSDGHLHCWQWNKKKDGDVVGADLQGHYPAIAEQYDWHEVQIVFWEAPQRGGRMSEQTVAARTIDDLDGDTVIHVSADYQRGSVHTNPDCPALQQARNTRSQLVGDLRDGYSLCRQPTCWGRREADTAQSSTCPYCDTDVGRLRHHLPCTDP